jgi:citrate synthase
MIHEIDGLDFPTSLGTSTPDEIGLLGQDLTADLMGKVGFGELAFWLVAMRRPTPGEVRVFEAVLVALADHGFTPTAIAARLTYLSAPDSLQGRWPPGCWARLTVPRRHRGLRRLPA